MASMRIHAVRSLRSCLYQRWTICVVFNGMWTLKGGSLIFCMEKLTFCPPPVNGHCWNFPFIFLTLNDHVKCFPPSSPSSPPTW
uniref:Uncharacterized protein n=1 Tax=Anguilla anguilla TaxID=7936 RepID=A0A0E9RJW6_ANGAN